MKKGFRIITAVLLAVLFSITSLQAAESAAETGLSFEGDSEKFITYDQQSAYENMMPGEKRVQRITLTNNDEEELKFYVRAEYTDPLGEAVADGHVAYNVEFVTNNESFYTGRIGGVTKANMNSLETNYLLRSIKKGETATIDFILQVDGDSMNDTYQDTEGRLRFIFSVEHMNSAPVEQAANIVKKIPVINKIPGVNTGDPTTIGLILGFFAASAIGLILLIIIKVRSRRSEQND